MTAEHKSNGKPPLALLPRAGLEAVAYVMAFGAEKYDLHNWRKGSTDVEFLSSTLRHIYKYLDGFNLDRESCIHHLAHAACDLLFLLQWVADGVLEDRRYRVQPFDRDSNDITAVLHSCILPDEDGKPVFGPAALEGLRALAERRKSEET